MNHTLFLAIVWCLNIELYPVDGLAPEVLGVQSHASHTKGGALKQKFRLDVYYRQEQGIVNCFSPFFTCQIYQIFLQ